MFRALDAHDSSRTTRPVEGASPHRLMPAIDVAAQALAEAFLAGDWTLLGLRASGAELFQRRARWLDPLIRASLRHFAAAPPRGSRDALSAFLRPRLAALATRLEPPGIPPLRRRLAAEPTMASLRRWAVRELTTTGELARWLGLTAGELDWFADRRGTAARSTRPKLVHYREVWIAKRGSGAAAAGERLLEIPRPRLRVIQRAILDDILSAIAPHEAALGFRRGSSAIEHASLHTGQRVLIRLDLEDFFAATPAGRVFGIFRAAGYPEEVARTLTAITTRRASPCAQRRARDRHAELSGDGAALLRQSECWRAARRLATAHLPQGSPSSPALANLAAFRLDVRLGALAARIGARYSRYADDLAFSGDERLTRSAERLVARIAAIVIEEGYRPRFRKTRIERAGARQTLVGLTVNAAPAVPRAERERLRAILTNCVRHGPSSQNRDGHTDFRAHLEGRVAWIARVNPAHARRLVPLLAAIEWSR